MVPHTELPKRPAAAVVMNLFYTGLGIARSLGERGVPVIGLTWQRGVYGNFSRYVRTVHCADSREEPEKLIDEIIKLGKKLGPGSVLFPTRDHDLVFLNRFRRELESHFRLVIPPDDALGRCLNKWETYLSATRAGVPTPKCWFIEDSEQLRDTARDLTYPCVLKPLSAHYWRSGSNWELVGGRKAISVSSEEQLLAEYTAIARADRRVLIQEEVPGGDECLVVAACYIDQQSQFQAGFNAQKLVQTPTGYGTGCIVQSADQPKLLERTLGLLREMKFTGIAEVEYKWDATDNTYKLIEINPRPWDQHRLGAASGVDLIYLAYCDHAGLPRPSVDFQFVRRKWIAEDAIVMAVLRLLRRRESGLGELFRQTRGEKIYAIWSVRDPLPFLVFVGRLIPSLAAIGLQAMRRSHATRSASRQPPELRATP